MRGNGRLLLRHWAELSNLIYLEAADREQMQTILDKAASLDLLFIDTPGLQRGQSLSKFFAGLGLENKDMAVHITFTPFCDAIQTQEFLHRYASSFASSLVWTKLDEAVSYGSIVNVSNEAKIPISALSYGGELQESLAPATEPLVWRLVSKRQIPGREAATNPPRRKR